MTDNKLAATLEGVGKAYGDLGYSLHGAYAELGDRISDLVDAANSAPQAPGPPLWYGVADNPPEPGLVVVVLGESGSWDVAYLTPSGWRRPVVGATQDDFPLEPPVWWMNPLEANPRRDGKDTT